MSKRTVEVTMTVEVELDDSKFTDEFMKEFRESFFLFFSLDDHAEHIAQLAAREIIDGDPKQFVEGYGPLNEMGIRTNVIEQTEFVTEVQP